MLTLLGLCGSLRAESYNRKVMRVAERSFTPARFIDGNIRFPLYDGDLETASGIPREVQLLADQIRDASAVVIATPEYNKSIPGVLKNALDWISRTKGAVWRDKPVAIVSASDGREGGARSQFALRLALNAFRPRLLPGPEVCVAHADNAFDAAGNLLDARYIKAIDDLMEQLRHATTRT